MERKDQIFIVGHKNPDTDSICAAISYAYLKNCLWAQSTGLAELPNIYDRRFIPCRAGQINEETEFVLHRWKHEPPRYLPNVGQQIRDMKIDEAEGASEDISVRIAWEYMTESNVISLPVIEDDGSIKGLLTISDIARYFMDAYNRTVLSEAGTKYYDIAETVNGEVIVGDENKRFTKGKVVVGAASPSTMEKYIEENDLVITGDRVGNQERVIDAGASCLVVTLAKDVRPEIREKAEEKGCVIICTTFDSFTAAKLINQAIPVSFLMKQDGLVTFHADDYLDDVKEAMKKYRFREYPVVDRAGKYIGMINASEAMDVRKKQLILVDHTEKSQAVDNLEEAEILEIIDHHRVGTVETLNPVYFRGEPVGCTCTIVYSMFHENGIEIPPDIAGVMASAIISDTLCFRSPTCTPRDERTCRELAAIAGIEPEAYAKEMFRAGSNLKGKSADEILHQDYKKFIFGDTVFGVGQISSMDEDELSDISEKLRPQLAEECGRGGTQMVFFMLTDILSEDTWLLSYGKGSEELIEEAYGKRPDDGITILPKVVSRKKQLIPAFMGALQE